MVKYKKKKKSHGGKQKKKGKGKVVLPKSKGKEGEQKELNPAQKLTQLQQHLINYYAVAFEAKNSDVAQLGRMQQTIKNLRHELNLQGAMLLDTVVIKDEEGELTYQLVPSKKGDPFEGKVAIDSKIGAALLNHQAGDEVKYHGPDEKETFTVKIVKVEKPF